jgi:hypothetical protein
MICGSSGGRRKLHELDWGTVLDDEGNAHAIGRTVRLDDDLLPNESFVEIVNLEGNVRDCSDQIGNLASFLKPHPFNTKTTRFKTADVDLESLKVLLSRMRSRRGYSEMMIPPSMCCDGRRLFM